MYCFSQLCGLSGLSVWPVTTLLAWDYWCGRARLADLQRAGLGRRCGPAGSASPRGFGLSDVSQDTRSGLARVWPWERHDLWKPGLWPHGVTAAAFDRSQEVMGQPRPKRSGEAPADARSGSSHGKKQPRRAGLQPSSEMICHTWFQPSSFFPPFLFIKLTIAKHLLWAQQVLGPLLGTRGTLMKETYESPGT